MKTSFCSKYYLLDRLDRNRNLKENNQKKKVFLAHTIQSTTAPILNVKKFSTRGLPHLVEEQKANILTPIITALHNQLAYSSSQILCIVMFRVRPASKVVTIRSREQFRFLKPRPVVH